MNYKGRRSKKFSSFQPNRITVSSAVDEFLKNGGKITKVDSISDSFKEFTAQKELPAVVDAFLMGENVF
ncbi:MAG: hypothetical protein HOD92_12645 [Deltaproteobacteria bacterium]|jgi:hypothetical protein|nr:hypothetical protein [Deltaproteobacteria bacterium]MBT4527512.1 hypothetical protein [Deltaproteobacteria bacterium]